MISTEAVGFKTPGISSASMIPCGRSLLLATACVLGMRLFLTVYLAVAFLAVPPNFVNDRYSYAEVPLLTQGWEGALLGVWQREDALWYEKIATTGYSAQDMTQEFFPLYPMAMRLVSSMSGWHPVAAAILISEAALILTLFSLHRLGIRLFDLGTANRAVWYLSIYPSAFFLHAPFTESLALSLALAGFAFAGRSWWLLAAAAGFGLGLTKAQGTLVGLPLAVLFLQSGAQLKDLKGLLARPKQLMAAAVVAAAPAVGALTYLLSVDSAWRRPMEYSGLGPGHGIPSFPGVGVLNALNQLISGRSYPIVMYDLLLVFLFLVLIVLGVRKLPPAYTFYAVLFFLPPLSRQMNEFPLMSFNRYALLLFPCFLVLAYHGRNPWVHRGVIIVSLVGLAFWSAMFYVGAFVA